MFVSRGEALIARYLLRRFYHQGLNLENFTQLSKSSIKQLLINEAPARRELFLRALLAEWVKLRPLFTATDLKQLRMLIKRWSIHLTERDQHDLTLIEERLFAAQRHFKILPLNLAEMPDEQFYIKFDRVQLYIKTASLKQIANGALYVSLHGLFVTNQLSLERFEWAKISRWIMTSYGFEFSTNNKTYVLRAHDSSSLNLTLYNFTRRKVPDAFRKRQDY